MIRTGIVSVVAVLAVLPPFSALNQQPSARREVCVTIDDLPWVSAVPRTIDSMENLTGDLLSGLAHHRIPAIGFVNEQLLQPQGVVDPRRVRLLQRWLDQGFELGNHTFSHRDLHTTSLGLFQQDVVRGERVTSKLLAASGRRLRYFRHPMLHTGRSLEVKQGLETFLAARGYKVAPVTIDNYDYIFARAYDRAADADGKRVLDAYIAYMTGVVSFYEQQSLAIVGREIRQILLLHANALNARAIAPLARMFEERGYSFITIDRALEDPAYASKDTYTGPAGMTWLHRWALTDGKGGRLFAGEPDVPVWIERAAAAR